MVGLDHLIGLSNLIWSYDSTLADHLQDEEPPARPSLRSDLMARHMHNALLPVNAAMHHRTLSPRGDPHSLPASSPFLLSAKNRNDSTAARSIFAG